MSITKYIYTVTIIVNLLLRVTSENQLFVHFHGVEHDYKEVKRLHPSLRYTEESSEYRNRICLDILRSHIFFYTHKVHYVSENETSLPMYKNRIADDDHKGAGYAVREIKVDKEVFIEPVMLCKTWNRSSLNFQDYFISPEYIVNSRKTRFLFRNVEGQGVRLIAMAEETAFIPMGLEVFNGETDYEPQLQKLGGRSYEVCALPTHHKTRLCTLGSVTKKLYFESVWFIPSQHKSSSDVQCQKLKRIGFTYKYNGDTVTDWFTGWAIRCEPEEKTLNDNTTFYISLGLLNATYFVSQRIYEKDKFVIVNQFSMT